MCHYPNVDESWYGESTHPDDLAGTEAWAYETKQGGIIPYFLGLQTIITPSAESAWVLILEHIPGRTLKDAAKCGQWPHPRHTTMCQSRSPFVNMSSSFIATIEEVTLVGLILQDIRTPSFLFTGDAVVIINLAWMSRPIDGDAAKVTRIALN
ncbi:hypothetical protein B0H16DRAFT_1734725 [Mycena metata]|uniref:Protein kinase domain-containing protein n=1 Tax=Mycena metata TaxID=1033252 RepID=A0AAD7MQF4_9AGAR|nr:hypothetical protein B0H16DRAFT_1734725 [Mycena metata]